MRCHFCTRTLGTLRDGDAATVNGAHWTGDKYVRIDLCAGCLDAGKLACAPKRPRRKRTAQPIPATDWNMLVAFTKGRR